MTHSVLIMQNPAIIPYQELLGNYDCSQVMLRMLPIIPYQELLGNYDHFHTILRCELIIPYQELLGNYDVPLSGPPLFSIIPYQELLVNYDCVWERSAHWYFCSCNAAAQKTAPSPSVLMVKAVPPSTTMDRASGIRIMGARRTRPPMCITAGFSPPCRRAAVRCRPARQPHPC